MLNALSGATPLTQASNQSIWKFHTSAIDEYCRTVRQFSNKHQQLAVLSPWENNQIATTLNWSDSLEKPSWNSDMTRLKYHPKAFAHAITVGMLKLNENLKLDLLSNAPKVMKPRLKVIVLVHDNAEGTFDKSTNPFTYNELNGTTWDLRAAIVDALSKSASPLVYRRVDVEFIRCLAREPHESQRLWMNVLPHEIQQQVWISLQHIPILNLQSTMTALGQRNASLIVEDNFRYIWKQSINRSENQKTTSLLSDPRYRELHKLLDFVNISSTSAINIKTAREVSLNERLTTNS
jgi:hypothetical protein